MQMRLLVIRTANIEALVQFYTILGFSFDYHKHGDGPYHYAAVAGKMVIEIYPLAKDQEQADKHLRIGLEVDNWEAVLTNLHASGVVFTAPADTGFGYMTVVTDPDGRKVEVYKPVENNSSL